MTATEQVTSTRVGVLHGCLWAALVSSCGPASVGDGRADVQAGAVVMTRAEFRARVGVDCITPEHLPSAFRELPIGFYRDYHGLGWAHVDAAWAAGLAQVYLPEIQYIGIGDTPAVRTALRAAASVGYFPVPDGVDAEALIGLLELEGLEEWLVGETDDGSFGPGTWFLLGNEPGYSSNYDRRSPAQIVDDAILIRGVLARHELDHRLALGGLSSPDTAHGRRSYGSTGTARFRFGSPRSACRFPKPVMTRSRRISTGFSAGA